VLLFIDNIFRFSQAGSEVSALLGRMPRRGYQPTLATEMASCRSGSPRPAGGHHFGTSDIRAADDPTDPAPAAGSPSSMPSSTWSGHHAKGIYPPSILGQLQPGARPQYVASATTLSPAACR